MYNGMSDLFDIDCTRKGNALTSIALGLTTDLAYGRRVILDIAYLLEHRAGRSIDSMP